MKALLRTVAAAVVLVVALGACSDRVTRRVEGSLVLTDLYTDREPCRGTGLFSDAHAGGTLRMQEGKRKSAMPIATAVYSEGVLKAYGCEFSFEFEIEKGFEEYTVISCFDGSGECQSIGYSWQDLVDQDFRLDYCRGLDCGGALPEGSGVDREEGGVTR